MDELESYMELKRLLKTQDFKKTRTSWGRDADRVVTVLDVKPPPWDVSGAHVTAGIALKDDGDPIDPSLETCVIRTRIEHRGQTGEQIFNAANAWFQDRLSLEAIAATIKSER